MIEKAGVLNPDILDVCLLSLCVLLKPVLAAYGLHVPPQVLPSVGWTSSPPSLQLPGPICTKGGELPGTALWEMKGQAPGMVSAVWGNLIKAQQG